MIDTGLKNKVVLVTGAQSGIGAATAKAFASQGAAVFVHYFRSPPLDESTKELGEQGIPGKALYNTLRSKSAEDVLSAIRDNGGQAEAWEADLSDPKAVPQLFEHFEHTLGSVDVLVNNASAWGTPTDTFIPQGRKRQGQPPELRLERSAPITGESHDRQFAVDSRASALMMAEYARRYVERSAQWGRIINLSSDGAHGAPDEVSYWASKAALESFSRSAALELGQYGITVNIVAPGPIQTGYITPELEEQLLPDIPLGRVGRPEDVADVTVFLASEQARWMTGQLLYVGGGHQI